MASSLGECLDYIERLHARPIALGLDRVRRVGDALGIAQGGSRSFSPEKDPPKIARELTEYTAKDGRKVRGVVRPEVLTEERLDRSLQDAEWWVEELTRPKEAKG